MTESIPSRKDIADRIRSIIRCDLKLGDSVQIDDDTELFGGDFDLDSLDALLLLQSMEKEFSFKAGQGVDPAVFRTVSSLSDYVLDTLSAEPSD